MKPKKANKSIFQRVNQTNKEDKLMQILLDAPYDKYELSKQTIKDIKKSREDIKKGRFVPFSKVMKELGL